MAYGLMLVWEFFRFWNTDKVARYYINPEFVFPSWGFEWIKPIGAETTYILYAILGLAAFCILIGFKYRIATITYFILYTYFFLIDESRYLNHYYLISMMSLCMAFIPANIQGSVDSKKLNNNGTLPAFYLYLLQFLIAIPYFFGGIAKINLDWLQGEPMRTWITHSDPDSGVIQLLSGDIAPLVISWGGLLLDLAIVPMLIWKRTRLIAFISMGLFHIMNSQIFQIGIFPWLMLAATVILFHPNWKPIWKIKAVKSEPYTVPKYTIVFVAVLVIYNILMPFRHLLYPGNVSWTEEGHKYAWHMKLRTKKGDHIFYAYDPLTKSKTLIADSGILLPHQTKSLTHPDRVIRYAKYLKTKFYPNKEVEIRGIVLASLNGRPYALLMDSTVDLAKAPITLLHNPIIKTEIPELPPIGKRIYDEENE